MTAFKWLDMATVKTSLFGRILERASDWIVMKQRSATAEKLGCKNPQGFRQYIKTHVKEHGALMFGFGN